MSRYLRLWLCTMKFSHLFGISQVSLPSGYWVQWLALSLPLTVNWLLTSFVNWPCPYLNEPFHNLCTDFTRDVMSYFITFKATWVTIQKSFKGSIVVRLWYSNYWECFKFIKNWICLSLSYYMNCDVLHVCPFSFLLSTTLYCCPCDF